VEIAGWRDFPVSLKSHIQQRVRERKISVEDLKRLDFWIQSKPEVPAGEWFKDFGSFKLCGEGPFPKTFLESHMTAYGAEL